MPELAAWGSTIVRQARAIADPGERGVSSRQTMTPSYRHTQFGWVTLAAVVPGLAVALVLVPLAHAPLPIAAVLALVALMAAAFSTLTVEVDAQVLRVCFTGGLIRRTIPLGEIRGCRAVKNPWYYGWGIHRIPRGSIWNAAGFDAIELVLDGDRVLRVGTDEPEVLSRALGQAASHLDSPVAPSLVAPSRPRRGALVVVSVVVLVGGGIVTIFSRQMADPRVEVTREAIVIETPFYGDRYAMSEVTGITLEQCPPPIALRTNGFSASGIHRGWFDLRGVGRAKLFVNVGAPPFIHLQAAKGAVYLNLDDPVATRSLYEQMKRVHP
jgi:hypothetical protein